MKIRIFSLLCVSIFLLSACSPLTASVNVDFTSDLNTSAEKIVYSTPIPGDAPFKGNPYSAVTLTEYSNFMCSACASYSLLLKELLKEFNNGVRIVYAHYPFAIHGFSNEEVLSLHNASECANDQDKFWEYHDAIYMDQAGVAKDFSNESLNKIAVQVGLDVDMFSQCSINGDHNEKVLSMKARGEQYDINATPTFFINDDRFIFDRETDKNALEQFIDAIKKKRKELN